MNGDGLGFWFSWIGGFFVHSFVLLVIAPRNSACVDDSGYNTMPWCAAGILHASNRMRSWN